MKHGSVAVGAGGKCAPAAPIGRLWPAPQLHSLGALGSSRFTTETTSGVTRLAGSH